MKYEFDQHIVDDLVAFGVGLESFLENAVLTITCWFGWSAWPDTSSIFSTVPRTSAYLGKWAYACERPAVMLYVKVVLLLGSDSSLIPFST